MSKHSIKKLAVSIEKINFLYRSIRKKGDVASELELALLKQYALELYDKTMELERLLVGGADESARIVESATPVVPPVLVDPEPEPEAVPELKIEEVPEPIAEIEPEPEIEEIPEPVIETVPEVEPEPEHSAEYFASTNLEVVSEYSSDLKETLNSVVDPEPEKEVEPEPEIKVEPDPVGSAADDILSRIQQQQNEEVDLDSTQVMNKGAFSNGISNPIESLSEKVEDTVSNVQEGVANQFDSVKTEILDDLVIPDLDSEEDATVMMPKEEILAGGDETVALEMNDILGRKLQGPEVTVEKVDVNTASSTANGDGGFNISFNQRFGFVSQLFNGDDAAYNRSLNDLGVSGGYIEALTYINLNLRHDYKWKDDDPTVKEFLEIVKRKFLG